MKCSDIKKIKYRCFSVNRRSKQKPSIEPVGLDTESYTTGKCFMLTTSLGDVYKSDEFPACFFSRKYRQCKFVAYNLKYDSGSILQKLPKEKLQELHDKDKTKHDKYEYTAFGYKCLIIKHGSHSISIYDMLNFYEYSLERASLRYLGESKVDQDVSQYTPQYVSCHWDEIATYCIQDARLVEKLAQVIIRKFEGYGIHPQKLFSTAYISYQYFRRTCPYVIVRRYWNKHKEVLQYALHGYQGGKFEVTQKGMGYYFEYDIISAYPFEVSNLVDISWARIVRSNKYRKGAIYAFLNCTIKISFAISSPCVVSRNYVNCYPIGTFTRVITKQEYDYLVNNGADVQIIDGYWLHVDNKQYPFKRQVEKLVRKKQLINKEEDPLGYRTIKILLNSLYGKFIQLIEKEDHFQASSCWNPIYGAVVTADCRIRVSKLQTTYPNIVAVHTDSIISNKALPFIDKGQIGDFTLKKEGFGVVLGSGVYQIGDKCRFRGFKTNRTLMQLLQSDAGSVELIEHHPWTWREVAARDWNTDLINKFVDTPKTLHIRFDQKRLWLKDYARFSDVPKRNVKSVPLIYPCGNLFD